MKYDDFNLKLREEIETKRVTLCALPPPSIQKAGQTIFYQMFLYLRFSLVNLN